MNIDTSHQRQCSLLWALLALLMAPPLSAQVVYTYDNGTAGAIPQLNVAGCATGLVRTFVVSDAFPVSDIAIGMDVTHPVRSELEFDLLAPNGTTNITFKANGSDGGVANVRAMYTSNPEAAIADNDLDPVSNSKYRRLIPVANATINAYTGTSAGTWTLRLCDRNNNGNAGTFNSARLVLRDNAASVVSACGNPLSFDWGSNGELTAFASFSVGGVTLTQTATSGEAPTDNLTTATSFLTRTTTTGAHPGFYTLRMDTTGDTELTAENVTFTFSEPATWLNFTLLDVDWTNNAWEDYIRVDGFDANGNTVPKQMTLTNAQLAFAGDWIETDAAAASNQTFGNINLAFARPINLMRVEYAQGDQPQTNASFQFIGFSDFQFCAFEYGDAPASYNTTIAGGSVARHAMGNRDLFMGTAPDGEADGSPGAPADGDGADEDGVTFPTKISPVGAPQFWRCGTYDTAVGEYCASVSASNNTAADAQLVGWVDFNADGDFLDANERSLPALAQATGGAADATFTTGNVPAGFTGTRILRWTGITNATQAATYLRLRITSDPSFFSDTSPQSSGQVSGGEMEDHLIPVGTLPVRLTYVQSERVNGRLKVVFSSASEVANVGYSIEEMLGSELRSLAPNLLASAAVNSAEVNDYQIELAQPPASGSFYIVDHDLNGGRNLRGPFLVGASYGAKPVLMPPDWSKLRNELALAELDRTALAAPTKAAKLWVGEPGFYRVSAAQLQAAGVDLLGVPLATIAVTFRGQGVPRRISAVGNSFDAASFIDFLVRPGYSLYSAELPYLVKADGVGVVDIASDLRAVAVLRDAWYWAQEVYAPDRWYNIGSPGMDPWQADRMLAFPTAPASVSLSLPVTAPASTEFAARIEAELIGVTNWPGAGQDHQVALSVNGDQRGVATFDGGRAETLAALVPGLAAGGQVIDISTTGQTGFAYDLVNLERVTLNYPRLPVAESGRLRMQQVNADANDGSGAGADDDGTGQSLFASDFEGDHTPPGFVASGFASGELVAYGGSGDDWRRFGTVVASNQGNAVVPLLAAASDYFIANVAALPTPRIEALPLAENLLSGTADYLIVSHAAFIDAMQPLVELQQSRGLSTRVVDVAQVFQQFGDGLPEGEAIRRYLKNAAASMGVRYVLLVGADTYDYKDFLGIGSVSLVPTSYQSLGNGIRYAPTDNALADFDEDGVPEIAIGRLPVRTLAEFHALSDKLTAVDGSNPGRRLLLVAGGSDAESDFKAISEGFAARLPGNWQSNRAYVDDLGVPGANNALLGQLNSGAGLVSYVGHSAPIQWSSEDQTLLTAGQVGALTGAVSDLVVQWGCWNSYFVSPRADTMAHVFLLPAQHGAAAVIGVSTLTEVEAHQALGDLLYPQLAPGARIGDALLAAKQALAGQQGIIRDILLASALLGDPAMPVR